MSDPGDSIDLESAAAARIGQVIAGRYRLGRLVGWGGMGMVFEAEHVVIRRPRAVKLLHPGFCGSGEAAGRFEREAVTAGRLKHPHCVDVSDFGQLEDGALYLVMELLAGRSLGALLDQSGRLPAARAIHIARQVLRGLAHAHVLGVVHRDIKPDNVFLVERDGDPDFVKLLDFGIAKLVGDAADDTSKLTRTGMAVGTPSYLAPEQVLGGALDARADLYSTTVVLYEMLSGRTPFVGGPVELVTQHLTAEPPRVAAVAPEALVSLELEQVIARGLSKSPRDRWASAEEYLSALDECPEARGRARTGSRAAPQAFEAAPSPLAMPRPKPPFDVRPVLRAHGKRIAFALIVLLILVAALSAIDF